MDILIELHLACNGNTVCDLEVAVFGKLKVCRVGRPTLSPSAGMVSYSCECRSSFPTVPEERKGKEAAARGFDVEKL